MEGAEPTGSDLVDSPARFEAANTQPYRILLHRMFEITVPNELKSLDDLSVQLEQFADQANLSTSIRHHLLLICEELFVNFTSYSNNLDGRFNVKLNCQTEGLLLTISSDGIAFNPLEAQTPDTSADLDDRPIGGLGIHLVRQLTDHASYTREDEKNVLVFRIPESPSSSS